MKCVLVTGGAGFIGSHLCERMLELGYRVISIDNFNDYYDPNIKRINIKAAELNSNYTSIKGDIRNTDILNEIFAKNSIDIVIHLAAMAGVRKSIETPIEYVDVDIGGTVNILDHCIKYNVKKIIFASSSSVYGIRDIPFDEGKYIDSPVSPYAAAKAAGELYCRMYNNLYGIPTVCLRFFTVYGPRQRPEMAIHNFTKLIDEGKKVEIYGDGCATRDFTYVEDILDGITSAVNYDCNFEIFNLGNSNAISINYLIDLIEKSIGKKALKSYIGMQMGDVFNTCADISKARRLLNYYPKVSIETGIEKFIIWYNNNKMLS